MRNVGSLILIGLVLMAALVVFLLWGFFGEKPGMRQPGTEPSAAEAPAQGSRRAEVKTKARRGRSEGSISTTEQAGGTGGAAIPSPEEHPSVVPPQQARVFPMAADIPIGMERSRLEAKFGKPNMVTTAVDRGWLIETFVYLRREPNTATVVLLRSGRVVGTNTTVY